jgi:hypothetical protein
MLSTVSSPSDAFTPNSSTADSVTSKTAAPGRIGNPVAFERYPAKPIETAAEATISAINIIHSVMNAISLLPYALPR